MTRRSILQQALVVPFAVRTEARSAPAGPQIISEPNCLSQESAEGFRSLHPTSNVILLCGVANLAKGRALDLSKQIHRGSWIVWESSPFCSGNQRRILRDVFGIVLREPVIPSSDHLYVRYSWPRPALTRTFSAVIPVACSDQDAIGRYGGVPVAMKRQIGRGGIVFLGSMLGPNLHAEERQANELVGVILSRITSAGTSTKASTNT